MSDGLCICGSPMFAGRCAEPACVAKTWDDKQGQAILDADDILQAAGLAKYSDVRQLLVNIKLNAQLIPDPRMEGLTDAYSVPLDDIDGIQL